MADLDQTDLTIDRIIRTMPENQGEPELSTLARSLVDRFGVSRLEVALDGSVVCIGKGGVATTVIDSTGRLSDPRFTVVTPEQFGAVVDGTTDNTAAFNLAIAALGTTGGIIQLAAKTYVLLGNILLPAGVILRGSNVGQRHRTLSAIGQTQETLTNGTIINLTHATGSATDTASITLQDGASACDFSLFEPNQTTTGAPTPYPYGIRGSDYGCNVFNVELVNNFRGIDMQGGRFYVGGITGNPLDTGINVDNCEDFATIENVRFSPTWAYNYSAVQNYVQNLGRALVLNRADNITGRNVESFGYGRGLVLQLGTGGQGAYGRIDNFNADGSIICIQNLGTGYQPLLINGATLISHQNCYSSSPGVAGYIQFDSCYAGGFAQATPLFDLGGIAFIEGCTFFNVGAGQKAINVTGSGAGPAVVFIRNNIVHDDNPAIVFSGGVLGVCQGNTALSSNAIASGSNTNGANVSLDNLFLGVQADPVASGNAPNGIGRFIGQGVNSRALDVGVGPNGAWLQSRDKNSYGVLYPLRLNPNGGVISMESLPTSASGLSPGDLWRNGNVINVV